MEYFGTSLTEHGHYRWDIDEGFRKMNYGFESLPFHPENLTNNLPKGEVVFYQGGGLTVIGISGSCKDERPGTKSIFWVKGTISRSDLVLKIMQHQTAMRIIRAMPFEVKWGFTPQT